MAFQNNNFGGNSAQNGEKKKTNFRVGRLYGSDGIFDLSIWNSDSAVFTIFMIKQAVGKDPASGANVYEQKAPSELPRVFLTPEYVRALLEAMKTADGNNINITVTPKRGSKLTMSGSNNQWKLSLETEKNGSRTMTFDAISVGSTNINASWKNLQDMLSVCLKKGVYSKLDPEEFGMAVSAASESEELPI